MKNHRVWKENLTVQNLFLKKCAQYILLFIGLGDINFFSQQIVSFFQNFLALSSCNLSFIPLRFASSLSALGLFFNGFPVKHSVYVVIQHKNPSG